ncbi:MAG: YggT family protein [Leptolyngbya sp. DLM2.Bin15]|nr:MAG: YggT family protein [Leptolyngbya sp. DLM2.Bin15]
MSQLIATSLINFLNFYTALLFIRILLTWFPTIDWSNPLLSALQQITDPFLNIFRSFIPPLGMIDISPMLAILALQLVRGLFISYAGPAML